MGELPSGTVTFCFTDIEGSTQLFAKLGPRFLDLLEEHRRIIRDAVAAHGGAEVKTEGDGFFLAFGDPIGAIDACVAFQQQLALASWPEGAPIAVRAGLHIGIAEPREGDYMTYEVHETARVSSAAHGGQTVISDALQALVERRLPPDVTLRDLGTHELKDLEPMRLHQICHPSLPDGFPPLRTVGAERGYVPAQTSSLIGRDDDLKELSSQLRDSRLVTVTGSGGVGKTRIAIEVARAELGLWPDGVWFIDLAPVTDENWVDDAVLTSMGVSRDDATPARAQLIEFLRRRTTLLVIDNCEHLIDRCTALAADVLGACQSVTVLATSREPLGLSGEVAWRARSLDISEGEALFAERARSVRPDLTINEGDAETTRRIVQRLDGIPLAIELAAARASMLSIQQIADRLDDRFKLLTGGARTALARQRTLEATVEWSYRLLDEREQALLRTLSVFAGSFDLTAAEAVGGEDTLDVLQRLVDKSMVAATLSSGEVRYRLLETIRHFSWTRLLDEDEAGGARDAHLAHYLALVARWAPGFLDSRENAAAAALLTDNDNIRVALEWAVTSEQRPSALRLLADAWLYWAVCGKTAEGLRWFDRVLPAQPDDDPEVLALASVGAAHLAWIAQRPGDEVRQHAGYADEFAETRTPGQWYDAWAAYLLATVDSATAGYNAEQLARSISRARKWGTRFMLSHALMDESARLWNVRQIDEAHVALREAVEVAEASGSKSALAEVLERKAEFLSKVGDVDEAVDVAQQGLIAARLGPNVYFRVFALIALSRCKQVRRDPDATASLDEALRIARDHGIELHTGLILLELGWNDLAQGRTDEARRRFDEAIETIDRLASGRVTMMLLAALARIALAEVSMHEGKVDDARAIAEPALMLAEASGVSQVVATGRNGRAWMDFACGDLEAAEAKFRQTVDTLAGTMVSSRGERAQYGLAVRGLAVIAFEHGDLIKAVTLSGAASSEREPYIAVPRFGMVRHDRMLALVRTGLSDEDFAAAWQRGEMLDLEGVSELLTQPA